MRNHCSISNRSAATARLAAAAVALLVTAAPRTASAQVMLESDWRISAAAGAFVPRSPIIVAPDGRDTQLGAGPSFSLELQYLAATWASVYANGTAGFSSVTTGLEISPAGTGPSDQVTVFGLTGGVVLSLPTGGMLGERLSPTLRLGGGLKGYSFELDGADGQWRPTADIGIGFRGLGTGPIEVSAEARYLPSSFDQAKLPTRAITPQDQRQSDLLFSVGVSIRP